MPRQAGARRFPRVADPHRESCRPAPDVPLTDGTASRSAARRVAHYTPQAPFVSLVPFLQLSLCLVIVFCAYVGFLRPHVLNHPDQFRTEVEARQTAPKRLGYESPALRRANPAPRTP